MLVTFRKPEEDRYQRSTAVTVNDTPKAETEVMDNLSLHCDNDSKSEPEEDDNQSKQRLAILVSLYLSFARSCFLHSYRYCTYCTFARSHDYVRMHEALTVYTYP